MGTRANSYLKNSTVSDKSIGRLSLYRRLLNNLLAEGSEHVYSHQLAQLAGGTPAQVRRDIMNIGFTGSPAKGYEVRRLIESIGQFLDEPGGQHAALVGVGNLGRAILNFFSGRRPRLDIVAAFDSDPAKTGRLIMGCPCHSMPEMAAVLPEKNIKLGIITVPAAEAQSVADQVIEAGVLGLLNFAPVTLHLPPHVYVEYIDMTMSFEKVAYFARKGLLEREIAR
jgi:redox-sensing transcriptional repressor